MKFFWSRTARELNDPDFGKIEWKRRGWEGQLDLWDYRCVQVLLDGDDSGPSSEQRAFYRALRGNPDRIRERIEESIHCYAAQPSGLAVSATQPLKLKSIFFPNSPPLETWRVWYDLEGEENSWFGAEITNGNQIVPFAED